MPSGLLASLHTFSIGFIIVHSCIVLFIRNNYSNNIKTLYTIENGLILFLGVCAMWFDKPLTGMWLDKP